MDPSSDLPPLPPDLAPQPPTPNSIAHDNPEDVVNFHQHLRPLFQPVFSPHLSTQDMREDDDGSSFGLRPLFRFRRSTSTKVSGMLNPR